MNTAAATAALAPAQANVELGSRRTKARISQFQLGVLSSIAGKSITINSGGSWKMNAARRRSSGLLVVSRDVSSETGKVKMNNQKKMKKKKKNETRDAISNSTQEEEDDDDEEQQQSVMKRLDDVNPVGLGRRSRKIFDEVWRKFSELGQISRTTRANDETTLLIREGGPMCEFAIPGAQNTTVLVIGATSRVGRIVIRKLMLRGYTVKVPVS